MADTKELAVIRRDQVGSVAEVTVPSRSLGPLGTVQDLATQVWSSFNVTDRMERAKLELQHMGSDSPLLSTKIGEVVTVEHVLAHRVQVVDQETGEMFDADRFVLIGPKGEAYSAVSQGIRKSLTLLIHYFGTPPWTPPLRLKVQQINTRQGRRTYNLLPA